MEESNYTNLKKLVCNSLKIQPCYCINAPVKGFVDIFLNEKWLRSVIKNRQFSSTPVITSHQVDEIYSALQLNKIIGNDWHKYLIQVLPKQNKEVLPINRGVPWDSEKLTHKHQDLSFSQLLNYVNATNMHILWNDSFLRYQNHTVVQQWKEKLKNESEPYSKALYMALNLLANSPIINISGGSSQENVNSNGQLPQLHSKYYPITCIFETNEHFYLIMEPNTFSLYQCVNFSPAKLKENECATLFLMYQLCQALENLHRCSLFLGNVSLHHLRLDTNFHLSVIPDFSNSLISQDSVSDSNTTSDYNFKDRTRAYLELIQDQRIKDKLTQCESPITSLQQEHKEWDNKTLLSLTQLWVSHEISNFDYLLCLSFFAGHSFDSPSHYPCIPWVTDFTSACNGWRDLTKTKYRLNKGDQQLNHTYELPEERGRGDQIAHHIPEFFSEVTYYVYKARITAKEVLQKCVRQHFVASHYPSSIGRMYALTPEECIPEFYCDPQIFKSIHEDMPDLEVPSWCSGIDDFVRFHRSCLESNYVSRRLHHWIDLYYGYKLTGSASIKAKNVCLPLVDRHTWLARGGVVQLFNTPHPPKFSPSPFLSKAPPTFLRNEQHDLCSAAVTKNPLLKEGKSKATNENPVNQAIEFPPNYNPLIALNQIEMLFNFSLKTNCSLPPSHILSNLDTCAQNPKALHQLKALDDLKVLGCLIIQILCPNQCRILSPEASLEHKVDHCKKVFKCATDVPKCFHFFLSVVFELEDSNSVSNLHFITSKGLPPPTSYQLLQPLIDIIPFPPFFKTLSLFINNLKIFYKFLNESECEAKVKEVEVFIIKIAFELKELFPQLSPEGIKILIPYLVQIYDHPFSSPVATLHLTDVILITLDSTEAQKYILPSIVKLYESDVICRRYMKLFQQYFILKLLTGFGLKIFLTNFTTPIIEAIGGHKHLVEDSTLDNRSSSSVANLKSVKTTSVNLDQLHLRSPQEEESLMQSNSDSFERRPTHRSSSVKTLSGAETDVTDIDNDTDMFVFESCEDDDESTIGDIGGPSFPTNEQNRSIHASDTDSGGEGSLLDAVSMASPCPSPLSLCTDDDFRSLVSNDDSLQYPSSGPALPEKQESLGIPIPSWNLPCSLSSPGECSKSLPDVPINTGSTCTSMTPQLSQAYHQSSQLISQNNSVTSSSQEANVTLSDISFETLLWLANKLGPVLTARHITRNLLRMLTLCYSPESGALADLKESSLEMLDCMSVTKKKTVGDNKASKVFSSLLEISKLYSEHFILIQYFNHITELVSWCGSKLSSSQEGSLIGAMSLLQHLISFLSDTTFMDHLQETLIRNTVYPVIRLLSSVKVVFTNGASVRRILAWRVIDCLCIMAQRVGKEMSKEKLSPAITRFLTAFDKVVVDKTTIHDSTLVVTTNSKTEEKNKKLLQENREKALEELKLTFTPELAYLSYIPLCKFLGSKYMEETLSNHDLLRSLCLQFDENSQADYAAELTVGGLSDSDPRMMTKKHRGQKTNNMVAVIGNRIDIQGATDSLVDKTLINSSPTSQFFPTFRENDSKCAKDSLTNRHLKGNWLAYWEHEIGRNEQDSNFNFKQIKLQSFTGHSSSVKALCALDTENSFISCSKDKTVKLWSLRSQGDGSSDSTAKWTYTNHKKSVFDVSFCKPLRLVASCDSTIHIWDPFTGTCLRQLDSIKHSPVTVLRSLAHPSTQLIAATTDSTLKVIDLRSCGYAQEMKITTNSVGIVRCLASSNDSKLVAVAHSSGVIATLDLRTGQLLATWKPHEGEVLTLQWFEKGTFISSALDQTICVWSVYDNKLKFSIKGPSEPVHLLKIFGDEIITGTTANRIGVHSSITPMASFSSTRLRTETLKGVMTAVEILPLNRQVLFGSDSGIVNLLC